MEQSMLVLALFIIHKRKQVDRIEKEQSAIVLEGDYFLNKYKEDKQIEWRMLVPGLTVVWKAGLRVSGLSQISGLTFRHAAPGHRGQEVFKSSYSSLSCDCVRYKDRVVEIKVKNDSSGRSSLDWISGVCILICIVRVHITSASIRLVLIDTCFRDPLRVIHSATMFIAGYIYSFSYSYKH